MKTITKLLGTAALTGYLYHSGTQLQITHYLAVSPKIPDVFDGFKILQLSDLHGKCFGEQNEKLLDAVRKEKPDIIVMTGDMVNRSDQHFDSFLQLARSLAARYSVYYIVGNHEQRLSTRNKKLLLRELTSAGVHVLDNEKTELTKGSGTITLYGLWCSLNYYKFDEAAKKHHYNKNVVEDALGACENGYQILLAHNPLFFPAYANWGADLTLCGHVHGGTVRLPLIGGLLSPERTFFPRYSEGEYHYKGKQMIVSRGLGDIRVCNPPEIPVITLFKK